MAQVKVSRTQWQWITQHPYTDGIFNCHDRMAAALVKTGAAEYVEADEFDTMTRRELMKHAKCRLYGSLNNEYISQGYYG